ncbi:leucine--tRNA ligase [Fluviispira multicolorata]|uniref:Leucine--tRNA ligase n=1 Tax=Fluviispira multicolorata TaxID=2654512 RepID=A0A833N4F1_9BACT|nr:leucine--tRNA ligase [Fluviispira multicolorata]KAB8030771.1 leucine--tRNA ligase [Fluviispira multicolorata]
MAYQHKQLEPRWQKYWKDKNIFKTNDDLSKPKYYALDMFPYPSAAGLHVGHPLGYTATDITSRYYRMKGYNVLHPMGWDAFGLPAEQHAIDTGEHPAKLTYASLENFKKQLNSLGFSYDWSREIATCDPKFFHWTQWIFTKLFEKGLAYQAEVFVNWCPKLKTVLANEEVIDGLSERGGHPVFRVPMKQWMLKITSYAERLIEDLNTLDWPESTKEIQRNWIGKSIGAKVKFALENFNSECIEVFTTRPDTLFGATYMVLAPEHPLVNLITAVENQTCIAEYREFTSRKSDLDRTELNKEKTGVFTGSYAINPVSNERIPIWISDYVMMGYGTGAIMAVPAHDTRDHEFALKFNLKIIQVVSSGENNLDIQKEAYTEDGIIINSSFLNGLNIEAAKEKIIQFLSEKNQGEKSITYKLRDWVFSRQRYWGEPIPIMKDSQGNVIRAFQESELPLTLPEVQSYEPTGDGKSPLSAITSWVQRKTKDGSLEFVETDTMPGSAGSSWYFLRYVDPFNSSQVADIEKLKYWMPVDLYIGGQEHAVGHLLYSRFWTKVLYDIGACPVKEPFQKLVHQGMICKNGAKMSKSKGNGINPDDVIEQYGADSLRVYEMFMGPLTQTKEWDDSNLAGVHRFLSRVERFYVSDEGKSLLNNTQAMQQDLKILHKTIKKVTEDIESLSFNTAIAQMMIFLNSVAETQCKSKEILKVFLQILSPFAPHLTEELWYKCIVEEKVSPDSNKYEFISLSQWPKFDPKLVIDNEIKIGVQVNGKHRGEITLPLNADQETAVALAMENPNVKATLEGKILRKTIYVANRILNFVATD